MIKTDFSAEDELETLTDDVIFSLALKLCGVLETQCITLSEADTILRKTREILSLGLKE